MDSNAPENMASGPVAGSFPKTCLVPSSVPVAGSVPKAARQPPLVPIAESFSKAAHGKSQFPKPWFSLHTPVSCSEMPLTSASKKARPRWGAAYNNFFMSGPTWAFSGSRSSTRSYDVR